MYYDEKWIDGKLCYKPTKTAKWEEFTKEMYANTVLSLEQEMNAYKPNFKVTVVRDDSIDAFGAYAQSSVNSEEGALVLLNVESCLYAGKTEEDVTVKEVLIETLMHEIGHALEEWYNLEFSEDRIETIIKSYIERDKNNK